MTWKDAWWLTRKELKYNWLAFLFTFLACLFMGLITAFLFEGLALSQLGEKNYYSPFLLDFMFVIITISLGAIFLSSPYLSFGTIKEDPLSKRMAFYRTLPISINALALSRTLLMLTTFFMLTFAFYLALIIVLSDTFSKYLNGLELFAFVLFWIGYALAFSGMNPYIEFGLSGRFLHINMPILIFGFFILIKLFFYYIIGLGIVESSVLIIKLYGWVPALIMLLVGIVGSYTWHSILKHRLLKRDYL